MTDEHLILVDTPADNVRRITLNRPEKRNAISTPLRVALLEQLRAHDIDSDVRVTILTLRRKLGDPAVIETVPGAGYRLT